LCHTAFVFEPLYADHTPATLPVAELLTGAARRAGAGGRRAGRAALVAAAWLAALPLGTCWTWHAIFLPSPVGLPAMLFRRGLGGLATDLLQGCMLSALIVVVFLGVTSLREVVRNAQGLALDESDEEDAMVGGGGSMKRGTWCSPRLGGGGTRTTRTTTTTTIITTTTITTTTRFMSLMSTTLTSTSAA